MSGSSGGGSGATGDTSASKAYTSPGATDAGNMTAPQTSQERLAALSGMANQTPPTPAPTPAPGTAPATPTPAAPQTGSIATKYDPTTMNQPDYTNFTNFNPSPTALPISSWPGAAK